MKTVLFKCMHSALSAYLRQENVFTKTYWLTGKNGYKFKLDKDVCMFIPKKVKLDRVAVMKKATTVHVKQE